MVCHPKHPTATIKLGWVYKKGSGNNTSNLVIPKNNISMCGDLFNLMKQPIQ